MRILPGAPDLDALNQDLVERINDEGRIYLTSTLIDGKRAIRFQVGQVETTREDVDAAFCAIRDAIAETTGMWKNLTRVNNLPENTGR